MNDLIKIKELEFQDILREKIEEVSMEVKIEREKRISEQMNRRVGKKIIQK